LSIQHRPGARLDRFGIAIVDGGRAACQRLIVER
jgi:hypothetical protein